MKLGFLALLLFTGCVPLGHGNHLVLGVGLFHAEHTNAVDVVKSDVLGFHAGRTGVQLGYSSVLSVNIPTNSNTILELKH